MTTTSSALDFDPIAEAHRQWEAHGWPEAAPGMSLVTTIVRVNQLLVAEIEHGLAPLGLTFARFEILRLLGFSRQGRLPMGKIGERLQVHPASVTSAVKRLERDRMIRRQPDRTDNRVVLAVLLPRGRSVVDEATLRVNRVFENLGFDSETSTGLLVALNQVRRTLGDQVPDSDPTSPQHDYIPVDNDTVHGEIAGSSA